MSRVVLVATGLAVAAIMLAWLTLWINPKRRGIAGRWVPLRALARPWVPHQAADVEQITGAPRAGVPESDYDSFRDLLREHLDRAGDRPVVLYLTAAGVIGDQGAVLLRDEGASLAGAADGSARQGVLTVEDLLDAFREAGSRHLGQSQLLIWDAGQVGSDRNLGVYANGFVARLRSTLAEKPVKRLAILSACAPGQTSWSSEFDGRSVFGYYVEQGLHAGEGRSQGLTVRSFSRRVRGQVSLWVRNHRQAEQTPELFGDESVDFALPRLGLRRGKAAAGDAEEEARVRKRLAKTWAERDAWQAQKPYRELPRPWLGYQEGLLRAERQFRAGEYGDAELTLGNLPNLANELKRVPPLRGSLALLERSTGGKSSRSELTSARDNLQEALDGLLGDEDDKSPAKEGAGEPGKEGAAAGGAATKGDAKAAPELTVAPSAAKKEAEKPASKSASSLSSRSLSSRRRVDSPLGRLIASDDDQTPLYPEAQLVVWANTFAARGPDRHAFRGHRGEALEEAIKTRILAEEAAASDERISRWIRPWVDAGDRSRRKAEDLLFESDPTMTRTIEGLEQANDHYLDARKNAEVCSQALDLVEQLCAELPYYAEWRARRPGRLEPGLDPAFVELLDGATELARQIHEAPPSAGSGDEVLTALDERIQRIKTQSGQVATAFQNVTDDFRNQWEGGRWRDLDAALCVPLIPADVRMRMLERVRSRTVASSLVGAPGADASARAADVDAPTEAAKGSGSTTASAIASRLDPTSSGFETVATDDALADPGFWRLASGLARLEVGLLAIGGAGKDEVAALRDAVDRASRRLVTSPFTEFADVSERIRNLRGTRLGARGEAATGERSYNELADTDRAARVMPLADSSGRGDNVAQMLLRFERRDLLTWHGQRLVEDFAPRHALVYYEHAKDDFGDSADLERAVEHARMVAKARLTVETNAPGTFAMDEEPTKTLGVKVKPEGSVPAGIAVAFIACDAHAPLVVKGKTQKAGAAPVITVSVDPLSPPQQADFDVERTDSTPESVSVRLEPGAFYRGHIFPRDLSVSALTVHLNPSKEGIDVLLRQSDRKLVRTYGDQFDRHPGQGFLHPHSPLAYKLVINHSFTRPTKVWVRYGLEGKDETFQTRPDIKLESGRPNEEIKDRVEADNHEIPTDKPRYLVVEMRKDNDKGRVVFRRRYPFRQILPAEYIRVQQGWDENMNMAFVNVWHLKSDPVSGPSELNVNIGGQSLTAALDRGRAEQWWRVFPLAPPPVPWRVQVERVLDAFKGIIETGVAPPQPPGGPPQPGQPPPAQTPKL